MSKHEASNRRLVKDLLDMMDASFGMMHAHIPERETLYVVGDNILSTGRAFMNIENTDELRIVSEQHWKDGVLTPLKKGAHPEENIFAHIIDVLNNIEKLEGVSAKERIDLRLIALYHDTYKGESKVLQRAGKKRNHAALAEEHFGKQFDDKRLGFIIRHHDTAYSIYNASIRNQEAHGLNPKGQEAAGRLDALVETLVERDALMLYLHFYKADINAGNKNFKPYEWLIDELLSRSDISEEVALYLQDEHSRMVL
jgi:hypothetical protein